MVWRGLGSYFHDYRSWVAFRARGVSNNIECIIHNTLLTVLHLIHKPRADEIDCTHGNIYLDLENHQHTGMWSRRSLCTRVQLQKQNKKKWQKTWWTGVTERAKTSTKQEKRRRKISADANGTTGPARGCFYANVSREPFVYATTRPLVHRANRQPGRDQRRLVAIPIARTPRRLLYK